MRGTYVIDLAINFVHFISISFRFHLFIVSQYVIMWLELPMVGLFLWMGTTVLDIVKR